MPEIAAGWTPNGLCSLFLCDIASFGHPARRDLDRHKVRAALYDGLHRSFDHEKIPFRSCYHEDRGDGVLMAVPPSVDTTALLTSLADRLRAEVRQHNDVSAETTKMRLRLAVHTGVVHSDGRGLVGTAVNQAFRILEAEQLRQVLLRTETPLALIASERVYEDVIRHGLGLVNPGDYYRVEVRVKETATFAWIRMPETGTSAVARPYAPMTVAPRKSVTVIDPEAALPAGSTTPRAASPTPVRPVASVSPVTSVKAVLPTAPDPARRSAAVTIADQEPVPGRGPDPDLEAVVDHALDIRQLHGRHVRDQIIGELPLALATVIAARRVGDDRADLSAIVRSCAAHPYGLRALLNVVQRFAGESAPVDRLRRSIDMLGQT